MSIRRLFFFFLVAIAFVAMAGIPTNSLDSDENGGEIQTLIAGRNVNMVSGMKLPLGDPWLQRQNEPSITVSSRNPLHLFAAANDYRTIDVPDDYSLPGILGEASGRDAWIGVFESFDGGESFVTMLLPGFPQDTSNEGVASPIQGFDTACDPRVCAGAEGLLYLSGIAFNRNQRAGVVFVARYVDRNNREKVEEVVDISGERKYVSPIEYVDTRIVGGGNPGQFIDMPNMAVDVPRGNAAYGNVYLAYTVFLGNTGPNIRSRIVFVTSRDGGMTWSKPVKLTESQHIIQKPVIAIDPSDPTGKTIYVAFRRFAHRKTPGGIVFVKSTNGGRRFTKPADVATLLCPFDQWTKGDSTTTSPRTNSYPTMVVDGNGIPYVAWAQRYGQDGMPDPDGQARIVISYSQNGGLIWSPPQLVDPDYVGNGLGDGHQFMPSMTSAGGNKTVIWYDQRDDISLHHPNEKFIEDEGFDHRHTIDVRAAEAPTGSPVFGPSILLSRYLFFMQLNEDGEPTPFEDGSYVMQGQYNYSGLPLFYLGTKPFLGDYIAITPSPQILPPSAHSSNSWVFNTDPSEPTRSHGVWADTRDVWPPAGDLWGDWINYNPPDSVQDVGFEQNPCILSDTTGMRNQNIYTADLNHGVIVGSPGNTKQLDPAIQRTFVVFVKNTTENEKLLNLTIFPSQGISSASFEQFDPNKSYLEDITVLPYSSVSYTVYVVGQWVDSFDPVRVDVTENSTLVGRVYLNPDSNNNPIVLPDGTLLGDEFHNPKMSNPKIWKYHIGNQNEPNASFLSPRAQNPRAQNSGYINPRAQNPRAQNPRAQNPRAQNENIVNNEMYNPRAQNPRAQNTALTDMTWTVTNDGNTTSAYTFDLRSTLPDYFNADPPPIIAQVLVYKTHMVPIDNECVLFQTHADELIVNVTNPRAQNPRAQNFAPTSGIYSVHSMSGAEQDFDAQDITFYLAPGEEAEVTLRVYDPDINDSFIFEANTVSGEVAGEAANTGDPDPIWVEQPNVPWIDPLPAIVASPISLSFSSEDSQPLHLSLSGLSVGESLDYSLSDDTDWLTVTLTSGTLDSNPLGHTVTVDNLELPPGSYVGTITVFVPKASNNPLRIPVYLTLGAIGGPEIQVSLAYADQISYIIEDGDTLDFGSEYPGSSSEAATFDIENIGNVNLTLGGKPIITIYGPDADQFRVVQQPTSPVEPEDSTVFTLQFAPTSVGQKTAMISIMNNDLDENPFDIALQGTGEIAGLVAYYPFNGNANDVSGNGNHGQVSGATLTADRFGNANRAYYFDGVDDIITTQQEHFAGNNTLSVSLWVNLPAPTVTDYFVMCSDFGVFQNQNQVGLAISLPSTNNANGIITYGQWHHLVGTYDGTYIRAYIDGVFADEKSWPGTISDPGRVLTFGFFNAEYWEGYLDDVRIYNYALSLSEIEQLNAQEAPGLVAYYPFNGNANDESGNEHHGTIFGSPTYVAGRDGNPGGAMDFDGLDDYVELPDESNFDLTEMTIVAIVKVPDYSRKNYIISKGSTNGGNYNFYINSSGNPGKAAYVHQIQTGNWSHLSTRDPVTTNQFLHIAVTLDGTSYNSYLNGQKEWGPINYSASPPILNDENASIGSAMYGITRYFFLGAIDEIRVYDRALSEFEIQALYSAQTAGAASYFRITGNSSMIAGTTNELTITAYDEDDNVATSYWGSKSLTFSGSGIAPDGTVPTVEGIDVGTVTTVNFTNGVSDAGAATLIAYKAESTSVGVSDGIIDSSFEDALYDLYLTVTPDDKAELLWVNEPSSPVYEGATWDSFSIEITDQFGNRRTDATDAVTLLPASLGGTRIKNATNGLATFDDITGNTPGTISVQGTAAGLTSTPTVNVQVIDVLDSVPNPSFELGSGQWPDGWERYNSASFAWDVNFVHHGSKSVGITCGGGCDTYSWWRTTKFISLVPGQTYQLSVMYWWDDDPENEDYHGLNVSHYDEHGDFVKGSGVAVDVEDESTQWNQTVYTFTVPEDSFMVKISLERITQASPSSATVWFDSVTLSIFNP